MFKVTIIGQIYPDKSVIGTFDYRLKWILILIQITVTQRPPMFSCPLSGRSGDWRSGGMSSLRFETLEEEVRTVVESRVPPTPQQAAAAASLLAEMETELQVRGGGRSCVAPAAAWANTLCYR